MYAGKALLSTMSQLEIQTEVTLICQSLGFLPSQIFGRP